MIAHILDELEPPHGDAVEARAVDGELFDVVKVEGEGGDARDGNFLHPKAAGDGDALERVSEHGEFVDLNMKSLLKADTNEDKFVTNLRDLDVIELGRFSVTLRPRVVDARGHHHPGGLGHVDGLQTGDGVEQPRAEVDLAAPGKGQRDCVLRRRLGVRGRRRRGSHLDFLKKV